jgi:hypothetical protein
VLVDDPTRRDMEVISELNCTEGLCRRLWVLCREKDAERYAGFGLRKIKFAETN